MTDAPQLILFGGTFDPPHLGHVQGLDDVLRRFDQAEAWVLPAKNPPGVGRYKPAPVLGFDERFDLCRMLFKHARVRVSDFEGRRSTPNYTCDLLSELRDRGETRQMAFMMGLDQFRHFTQWRNPLEILRSAALIVVNRSSSEDPANQCVLSAVTQTMDALEVQLEHAEADRLVLGGGLGPIFIQGVAPCEAESRLIRRALKDCRSLPAGWLSPDVYQAIEKNGYYK